jgi:hypothetical protein
VRGVCTGALRAQMGGGNECVLVHYDDTVEGPAIDLRRRPAMRLATSAARLEIESKF